MTIARQHKGFPPQGIGAVLRGWQQGRILPPHAGRLRILLTARDNARQPQDMDAPGFRLHRLSGRLEGFYAVSVSGNWRLKSANSSAVNGLYLLSA